MAAPPLERFTSVGSISVDQRQPGERKQFHQKLFKTPKEIATAASAAGVAKSLVRLDRIFVLGILAGMYIAFGGLLAIEVGGGMPGIAKENPGIQKLVFAAAFTFGLMLVVIAGAELFTGNTMFMTIALLHRKISIRSLLLNWGVVYLGNFVGSILCAVFFGYVSELLSADPWYSFLAAMANKKVYELGWGVLFVRAIGCNWLVTLAIWLSISAEDIISKIAAIFWPIFAFVAIGFEHSVANMFFVPAAIMVGADVNFGTFLWKNLLPVTLGNIIGGAICTATGYWYLYLIEPKPPKPADLPA